MSLSTRSQHKWASMKDLVYPHHLCPPGPLWLSNRIRSCKTFSAEDTHLPLMLSNITSDLSDNRAEGVSVSFSCFYFDLRHFWLIKFIFQYRAHWSDPDLLLGVGAFPRIYPHVYRTLSCQQICPEVLIYI